MWMNVSACEINSLICCPFSRACMCCLLLNFRFFGQNFVQWMDGAGTRVTNGPDGCNYNLVTGNEITTRGNECVDIKEGASFNVIEHNECQEQLDDESGCYDSRGNDNTFR